ncbi:alcohol dehydrogenase family protein [Marinimicrobium sp. ABcell2]|uniref:alcohol dehydrogenase family protein n=1 Tax=Marinimicrobium sp. ABcell2 TaxID=3069751 RepID=UPI0027B3DB8A|nr:alcohol dehydrogenase family protein [Marinimicrobium sp. ABcell2]MDQ2077577.1 alcohol dehydrogenase family protein [Marinimicrobium sp. ABcell2]
MHSVRLPDTMKAVQLIGYGGLDKLIYRQDLPLPEPGAGEVLVQVSACGMNNTDVWVREGAFGDISAGIPDGRGGHIALAFPRIQGTDSVGRIVAVGSGVNSHRIGERVIVDFCLYQETSDHTPIAVDYMGHGRDGGYAEYLTAPADNAQAINSDMTDAELATFCCAYLTAERMLDRSRLTEGERVLVTGASGGVGSAVVQLARVRGAIPYVITSRGKEAALKNLGAEAVVLREKRDVIHGVEQATEGQPIDVVADVVAGPLFSDLLHILRPEGRYCTAGAIAGPIVHLDLRTLYLKQLELHGSSQGTREAFQRLVRYIEEKKLRPLLDQTFRLSDFHRAQQTFMGRSHIGKLVVVPDSLWEEKGAPYAH